MLKALTAELLEIPSIQLTVLLDFRIEPAILSDSVEIITVSSQQCMYDLLSECIAMSDAVWPIAPEMDQVLQNITALIEGQSKVLLNSSSAAVAVCGDKLLSYQKLDSHQIAVVNSFELKHFLKDSLGQWVIKPKDGAGCLSCYLVSNPGELSQICNQLGDESKFLIQPYVQGETLSLSCLFSQGQGWLLCCNQQQVSIHQQQFQLNACLVNIATEHTESYQNLINQVAACIPDLSAYVGIDIIHPENELPMILEINPRLTTSYVGVNQALGINVAEYVLELKHNNPLDNRTRNHQIAVPIC